MRAYFAAKLWIVGPALLALLIMAIFGEGFYILPVMAVMWAATFIIGWRMRRAALPGTFRRAVGFWVCLWSAVLAVVMITVSLGMLGDGTWLQSIRR